MLSALRKKNMHVKCLDCKERKDNIISFSILCLGLVLIDAHMKLIQKERLEKVFIS